MRHFDLLGIFVAEPGEDKNTLAIARPDKEKLCVSHERADYHTGCLCKSLPGRSFEKNIAIGQLPNQVCRYCSYRFENN